jgi:hypothetical protein
MDIALGLGLAFAVLAVVDAALYWLFVYRLPYSA